MTYTRGSADDYDRLAAVTGDSGWSWSKLEPYMRKVRLIKCISSRVVQSLRLSTA